MSSKSSQGPTARSYQARRDQQLGNLTKILSDAVEKYKERQEREGEAETEAEAGTSAASGLPTELPKPLTQTIYDDRFEWDWEPMPDQVRIHATFDRELQSWMVQFNVVDNLLTLTADQAKDIGEALLASYAWQSQWKLHVADYILGEKLTVIDISNAKAVNAEYDNGKVINAEYDAKYDPE